MDERCPVPGAGGNTYKASIALVRDRKDSLSKRDREWLMAKTAEAVYFYACSGFQRGNPVERVGEVPVRQPGVLLDGRGTRTRTRSHWARPRASRS